MAGRRPKSAQLKLVTGNPGHRRIPTNEPTPVPGWPTKPEHLGKVASAEWDRLATLLEGEQRLSLADAPHLTGAAIAYETALEYRRRAKPRGVPSDDWRRFKTGERIQWDTYRKFVNDLCLSQGTRARAKTVGRGKETSRLAAFLQHGASSKRTATR